MKQLSIFLIISLIVLSATSQQRNCGTIQYLEFLKSKDPQLKDRMANNELKLQKWIKDNSNAKSTVLTIPVVVHVVWNINAENISDSQIFSQMDVLNEDFRRNNNDASNTPSVWQNIAADCEIEFCLATTDPNGLPTNGITRTQTSQTSFSISNDDMKSSSSGGIDPWDQDDYLNIWVCDLSGGILGYATLPSNFINPADGIVIGYKYFGTIGTVQSPYNKGRTATHEVGHWLNLDHIWGNGSSCGNDNVSDTPTQEEENYSCPIFPHNTNSCGTSNTNGDMFMNYMDYTNDACMNMFTLGQKTRMIASINTYRSELLTSNGCQQVSVYGCTDIAANNYDPNATIDDGSCAYCISTLPYSEDFNNGIGNWLNTGSAGNWALNSGSTTSLNTGPTDDVTGGGSYMYIESSAPNYPSVGPFTLTSECFDLSNLTNISFSFYYNMYGSAVGILNVYANNSLICTINGNQGQGWNLVQIPLTPIGNTLVIEFEGTTGPSWAGDIAIDNINIIGNQQISGCTNPLACNYNPLANNDDESCLIDYGCTDALAINYDFLATCDDGSCLFLIMGCTDTAAINFDPLATIDDESCVYSTVLFGVTSNITCNGLSDGSINLSVTGGIPPYTYLWSNGAISQDISSLAPGLYSVVVIDGIGQTFINSFTLTEPSELTAIFLVSNVTSSGGSDGAIDLTPSGGTPPYSFFWYGLPSQNFPNSEDVSNLLATTYSVYIVDGNNCFISLSINVIEDLGNQNCSEDSPTGLFSSNVIHNRATINWDNMNSGSCFVDQYRIRYRVAGTSSWSQKTMSGPVGSCNYASQKTDKLLLGLTASSTYEYQMKAWYCGGGNSSWSAVATFTTLSNCPNVANLAVVGVNPSKANFTWDASNGTYAFVRLKARVDSISNPTGADFFQIGGAGVSYGINTKDKNGLTPGETYRCQARTYCSSNGGWKSPVWTPLVYWTQPTQRIEGGEAIANLAIYPNPSKDVFNITFTSEEVQDLRVRVMNIIGEEIIIEELEQFIGEYTKQINLEDNAKGIYFLEIETNDGVINKKLILQ